MQLHKIKNEREGIVLLFYLSKKELSKVRYLIMLSQPTEKDLI